MYTSPFFVKDVNPTCLLLLKLMLLKQLLALFGLYLLLPITNLPLLQHIRSYFIIETVLLKSYTCVY